MIGGGSPSESSILKFSPRRKDVNSASEERSKKRNLVRRGPWINDEQKNGTARGTRGLDAGGHRPSVGRDRPEPRARAAAFCTHQGPFQGRSVSSVHARQRQACWLHPLRVSEPRGTDYRRGKVSSRLARRASRSSFNSSSRRCSRRHFAKTTRRSFGVRIVAKSSSPFVYRTETLPD